MTLFESEKLDLSKNVLLIYYKLSEEILNKFSKVFCVFLPFQNCKIYLLRKFLVIGIVSGQSQSMAVCKLINW